MNIFFKIVLWLMFFATPMHLSYLILEDRRKNSYLSRNLRSGLLFILFTLFLIFAFGRTLSVYFTLTTLSVFVLFLVILVEYLFADFFNLKFPLPTKLVADKSAPFFLNFSRSFLFTKIADIVFQQLMILILLSILTDYGLSLVEITAFFVVFFTSLHSLTLIKQKIYGLYFLIFSFFGSFIFPILIMRVAGGMIYSTALHAFSYLFGRVLFWFLFRNLDAEKSK